MTYYTDEKYPFLVDGKILYMTEEQAEDFQEANPDVDIQHVFDYAPLTVLENDDIIDCTCTESTVCRACEDFFRSLI